MNYRLLVIDAQWLAFRKFCADENLAPGFLWALLDLRDEWKPGAIYCVWDDPRGAGRRRQISESYKGNRKPKKQAFIDQVANLRQVLSWMGVTQFDSAFGEGDDCAATIARRWPGPILLYSADKDWLQLVNGKVHMVNAGCGGKPDILVTGDTCEELTGLSPAGWTDFLALAGDSADCVSGVPGVGETWARRIVSGVPGIVDLILGGKEESARELAAGADEAKLGKYVELAIQHRAELDLARKLVELHTIKMECQAPDPDLELTEVWMRAKEMDHMIGRI